MTRPHLVTVALLVGTFLAALDVNVVGAAMPTVVGQLGGLSLYGWVFSAYLLTATSTVPLYGRLADLYGRKPMYLVATALFLIGSTLCGLAGSMLALILFRAVQGLGAGGLLPLTLTIFGDIFPAEKRALVQGLFSTVWGVSSVLGPLIGGFLVSYVSWRWIFWINLPIGLVSTGLLVVTLHEHVDRQRAKLDLAGSLTLIAALVCLLIGLQAFQGPAGDAGVGSGLLVAAALLAGLFVVLELRAVSPALPLDLFKQRVVTVSSLSGLVIGSLLLSMTAFVPLYVQGALRGSPTQAGLALVPMSIPWTVATFFVGVLCRRFGYRPVVVFGGLCCLVGAASLSLLQLAPGTIVLYCGAAMVGLGMGLTISPMTIAVQDAVPWDRRGIATALLQFFRTIGGMITVTVLSAVISGRFARGVPARLLGSRRPSELLDPKRWQQLPAALLEAAATAMHRAILVGIRTMGAFGLAILVAALTFPALRIEQRDRNP